jgi:hypothetical protein
MCANALRPNGAKPPTRRYLDWHREKSSLPEQLSLSIRLMQPTPGILLGQHFRQALLQDHADHHMLWQGAQGAVDELAGKPLLIPRLRQPKVDVIYIAWHNRQVFKGAARNEATDANP